MTESESANATKHCYACGEELPANRLMLFLRVTEDDKDDSVVITAMHDDGRCNVENGPSAAWLAEQESI